MIAINLVNLPPWLIACEGFNETPVTLSIAGVRASNRTFFESLEAIKCHKRRGEIFHDYLDVKFALHQWEAFSGMARRSLRNSYVRFLRGWGVDSNSIEGAVLKSWVQSRFGVTPTYHRKVLRSSEQEEDTQFAIDRMKGSAHTNAIYSQLDLLYEFCQYELSRRFPNVTAFKLYRGTNDPEEHPVRETRGKRESCVRLNNLVSFTSDREKAWEFGSTVWQAMVPLPKVIFFSELLPDSLLKGEGEYLVIGGNYWVKELLW